MTPVPTLKLADRFHCAPLTATEAAPSMRSTSLAPVMTAEAPSRGVTMSVRLTWS